MLTIYTTTVDRQTDREINIIAIDKSMDGNN